MSMTASSGAPEAMRHHGPVPRRFALGASARHRTAKVDGIALAYDDRGEGFPMIGMHAVTHGSRDFEHVAGPLSKSFRFITFDWPGQGRSGDDRAPPTAARYAELLDGFMNALGIDRAILIGSSIGGSAALRLAAASRGRVAALVLVAPGGLTPISTAARWYCGAMAALGGAGQRNAWYFRPLFGLLYRMALSTPEAGEQRRRIVDAARESAALWEQAWLAFREPEASLTDRGPKIACPTLFVWARKDMIIPFALSKPAIAGFPNHQIALVQGGHCPFLEVPEAFLANLLPFLDRIPETDRSRRASIPGRNATGDMMQPVSGTLNAAKAARPAEIPCTRSCVLITSGRLRCDKQ